MEAHSEVAHEVLASMLIGAENSPIRFRVWDTAQTDVLPVEPVPPRGFLAIVLPLRGSLVARSLRCLALPSAIARARRALTGLQLEVIGAYGVEPNLAAPVCLFELRTVAAHYAESHLRPTNRLGQARKLAAWVWGVDPTLGGVVVLGRRS